MRHITLQHVEIALAVFQAYCGRFPDSVQDILQGIWREKQKIVEERERLEKEAREKEEDTQKEPAETSELDLKIEAMDLQDLAK